MKPEDLFDWLRDRQPNEQLTQDMVDRVENILQPIAPEDIKSLLEALSNEDMPAQGAIKQKPKLKRADIVQSAKALVVEPATLKAVIDIEAKSSGFDDQGRPTILFERHKMYKYLTEANYITKRDQLSALFPDICNEDAGSYNTRGQYDKLAVAEVLHWTAAHKSCSFGLGQIMGFNAESLGYRSLKAFVDAMYESEANQLDAMCRYIKVNNLVDELQRHDWAGFARGYNGRDYAINKYDTKLAAAYIKAKKQGW